MRSVLFLRRVNVDGSRLKMADLLKTLEIAGYPEAVAIVASGNLIVWSDSYVNIEAVVGAVEDVHGFTTEIYCRSEHEVRLLPAINPFADDGGKVEVVFLPGIPPRTVVDEIAEIATGPDRLRVVGSEIFWWRPLPLQPAIPKETHLRKVLSTDSTRRTMGTIERIIAKLDSSPA